MQQNNNITGNQFIDELLADTVNEIREKSFSAIEEIASNCLTKRNIKGITVCMDKANHRFYFSFNSDTIITDNQ